MPVPPPPAAASRLNAVFLWKWVFDLFDLSWPPFDANTQRGVGGRLAQLGLGPVWLNLLAVLTTWGGALMSVIGERFAYPPQGK